MLLPSSRSAAEERTLVESRFRRVTDQHPIEVHPRTRCGSYVLADGLFGVDFSGWLSATCGLLSIYQFDIHSGDAITGGGKSQHGHACPEKRFLACLRLTPVRSSTHPESTCSEHTCPEPALSEVAVENPDNPLDHQELAQKLQDELARLSRLVRDGSQDDVRSELISRFCAGVKSVPQTDDSLADLEVTVSADAASDMTMLTIRGTDTRGFLFELAHALSISRFRMRRASLKQRTIESAIRCMSRSVMAVRCVIMGVFRNCELPLCSSRQFTHWLPTTGDPHQALLRFRELLERLIRPASEWQKNLASLQKPSVLHAVARVLGISQYLWEDFLRSRHEELFPMLANASELGETYLPRLSHLRTRFKPLVLRQF